MKMNPFSKRTHGIGPGPGDMAEARIRAMATINRRAKQELAKKDFERSELERGRKEGRD